MFQTTKLQLSGLTCGACEKVVSTRLKTIEGVQEVHVSSQNGFTSIIALRLIDPQEVTKALQDTHYKIVNRVYPS
ncbi:MAG TPA: heavy metal-associated domain-containing protein [Patescibacteria group bacterium]|nr:heavy metal-associated domain-containing protein [Patescibacteria group bacterium]